MTTPIARPHIKSLGGIHQLQFPDARLFIQASRFTEGRNQETMCELRIRSTDASRGSHLHQARFNLTSTTARRTLVKHMDEIAPGIAWNSILEYVAVLVLEAHRTGENVIQMSDHAMPEGLGFRVAPFLQERQATILFGEGDTGKSWMGLLMGYLVATGQPALGMEPEPGAVLYLDYETDEDTMWERLNLISTGFNAPIPDQFYYRRMTQRLANDLETLNQHAIDKNISLVVVDSAAPATGEPEEAAATTEYFQALRALRVTSLTIAHVAKGGKFNEPFGSTFWRNLPRANFRVRAEHEAGSKAFTVGLTHTKSNNGRRLPDHAYKLSFDDQSLAVRRVSASDITEIEEGMTVAQRIASALNSGAMTTGELSGILDVSEASIRKNLNSHRDDLFVQISKDDGITRWGNLSRDYV